MKLFDELKWRGLINDVTSPDLEEKLNEGGLTFYIGTDPTGIVCILDTILVCCVQNV